MLLLINQKKNNKSKNPIPSFFFSLRINFKSFRKKKTWKPIEQKNNKQEN